MELFSWGVDLLVDLFVDLLVDLFHVLSFVFCDFRKVSNSCSS